MDSQSSPSSSSRCRTEPGNPNNIIQEQLWNRTISTTCTRSEEGPTSSSSSSRTEKTKQFREQVLETILHHVITSPDSAGNSKARLSTPELPKDLEDLLFGEAGLPVETLSIILELKNSSVSSSSLSKGHPCNQQQQQPQGDFGGIKSSSEATAEQNQQIDQQRLGTLLRKLVTRWISENYTAECLVSFALAEDSSWATSERNNFFRLVFALPETFVLSKNDFLSYSLSQVLLALSSLSYGIQNENFSGTIHSQPISTFLDKLFLRFHCDGENFYGEADVLKNGEKSKFFQFVEDGAAQTKTNFVARRLLAKVFKGMASHTGTKLARTIFLLGLQETCPAVILLHPPEEFLDKSCSTWWRILCSSIPLKTPTTNKTFWVNWSFFICHSITSPQVIVEVWKTCVSNWQSLCQSSVVNCDTLIPATYALVALARQIKHRFGNETSSVLVDGVKVFESVAKCLDSTVDEKRACGMALAQVMAELHTVPRVKENEKTEEEIKQEKLKFHCGHIVFRELIEFYEKGVTLEKEKADVLSDEEEFSQSFKRNLKVKKDQIEVLDSDDDIIEEDEEMESNEDEEDEMDCGEEEFPINETVMSLTSRKVKMPIYFSDIVEVLVEGGDQKASKNESDMEALKYIAVMRIPLLLASKVRIDPRMAKVLCRVLVEFDSLQGLLDIPVLFALFELAHCHPSEVFDTIGQSAFNHEHYTTGQRMNLLRKYSDIVQLLSHGKCYFCFQQICLKNRKEWGSYCSQFVSKYCDTKKRMSTFCSQCKKNPELLKATQQEQPNSTSFDDSNHPLTWREIVDRRIESKTRYFSAGGKKKNISKTPSPTAVPPVNINQVYCNKIVPIAWLSISNRLMSRVRRFVDPSERKIHGGSNDLLLSQVFRLLGRIILETGSSACPHLGTIASQVGDLVRTFVSHEDPHVRQSVFALLAITISITDAAPHIIESISGGSNIIANLKLLRDKETFSDNKALLDHLIAFVMHAASLNYKLNFDITSTESNVPKSLRIVKDDL